MLILILANFIVFDSRSNFSLGDILFEPKVHVLLTLSKPQTWKFNPYSPFLSTWNCACKLTLRTILFFYSSSHDISSNSHHFWPGISSIVLSIVGVFEIRKLFFSYSAARIILIMWLPSLKTLKIFNIPWCGIQTFLNLIKSHMNFKALLSHPLLKEAFCKSPVCVICNTLNSILGITYYSNFLYFYPSPNKP